jgi:DNA replication protein DnaC
MKVNISNIIGVFMKEFVPCRKCIGKNGINPKGYIVKKVVAGDGKTMVEVAEECECHKAWREEAKLEAALQKANIAPDIMNIPFDNYVGQKSRNNMERLRTFTTRSLDPNEPSEIREKLAASTIYIYGPNGTQKTTLAMRMGYEFLKKGKKVKYILMNDLIKMLMKAERDEDIQAQIEKLTEVDLLIIDESFMKERVTIYRSGYQLSFLDTFLRNRIQSNKRGVIFISNISMDDIDKNIFGEGLIDLVKRNVTLNNGNMLFEDNYLDQKSEIQIESLF